MYDQTYTSRSTIGVTSCACFMIGATACNGCTLRFLKHPLSIHS